MLRVRSRKGVVNTTNSWWVSWDSLESRVRCYLALVV
jgi:hypothetical protein